MVFLNCVDIKMSLKLCSDERRRFDLLPLHDCQLRLPPQLLRADLLLHLVAENEGDDQTNSFRKLIIINYLSDLKLTTTKSYLNMNAVVGNIKIVGNIKDNCFYTN